MQQIIAALNVQAKDGHFVLKIFESFTIPTVKLLYILSSFYNETYIYKPSYSRPTESER
jgi:23S rRNA U2552 (ribose-2'-O)-methylase RlmE/FtsJ